MIYQFPDELMFLKNRNRKQKKSVELMNGKLCVVSGGTSGVGLQTVKQLAAHGANLVLVARNENKANQIKEELVKQYNVQVDIVIADFSRLEDVRNAAKQILNQYNKIDVLINSAGLHSTKKTYTVDGYETVFCVNHLAPLLFAHLLLERLKESAPARIIQVNSEGHRFSGLWLADLNWKKRIYTGLRGYAASKSAQLLSILEMADELEGTGVTINAVHPGEVKSNIGSNNGWLYRFFFNNVTWHFLKDPVVSGEAIYYLASSSEVAQISGRFFNLTHEEVPARHARWRRRGKKLYRKSMEMVGLNIDH